MQSFIIQGSRRTKRTVRSLFDKPFIHILAQSFPSYESSVNAYVSTRNFLHNATPISKYEMSQSTQEEPIAMNPPVMIIGAPVCQPPTMYQSRLATKHTSCGMVSLGVLLILCSIGSIGMSAYIIIKIGTADIALASICSGSFFFIMGVLSIYGGSSVWERKGTIIISSIFGLIGIIAAMVAAGFTMNAMQQEEKNRMSCLLCHTHIISNNLDFSNKLNILKGGVNIISEEAGGACDFMCSVAPYLILGGLAVLEGIFGLILSCSACCNYCSCCCCYKAPPTDVPTPSFPNFPAVTNMVYSRPSGDYAYNRLEA